MSINSTVSVNSVIQFSAEVHKRVQQTKSKLQSKCKMMALNGKAAAYDGIGTVELGELNSRYAAVTFGEIEHFRRKITKRRFGATLPIDDTDVEERLTNPQSGYAEALSNAAQRQMDHVIRDCMFADVLTGEDFETTTTFAAEGGLSVNATAGLTYEKLLEINQNFIDSNVTTDSNRSICMGITGTENTDLMSELELTSGDYSKQYIVDKGYTSMAVGIEMILFAATPAGAADPILPVVAGTRTTFAMADGAVCIAMAREWSINVVKRNDLYDTTQVQITGVLGAVRTEAALIQKVTTTA